MSEAKPFVISRWEVLEAYKRVKANQGAAGGWEMTEQGRAFAAQLRTRRQAKPNASSLSE